MKVVALVWADRHKTCIHREAMQVATYVAVHICKLMSIEIVACREAKTPVGRRLNIPGEAKVLSDTPAIFNLTLVERPIAVVDRVVELQAPRTLPLHVSIRFKLHLSVASAVSTGGYSSTIDSVDRRIVASARAIAVRIIIRAATIFFL